MTKRSKFLLIALPLIATTLAYSQDAEEAKEAVTAPSIVEEKLIGQEVDQASDVLVDEKNKEEDAILQEEEEEVTNISGLIESLNIETGDIPPSATAHIKILEKFNGKTYDMIIDNANLSEFEDDLEIKLIRCWKEPESNLIDKYTALITVNDLTQKKSETQKHWVFNHNVELNTFSTEKYYIFLDSCE